MQFVRLIGGAVFSLSIALSATGSASAGIHPGGTLVEFDQDVTPMIWLAGVRTVIRNLPVRV